MPYPKWKERVWECCVLFYTWLSTLPYFPLLAPEDTEFCDLRLQVKVGGETSEVTIPLHPHHQTEPRIAHRVIQCQRDRPCPSQEVVRLLMGAQRAQFYRQQAE